MEKEQDQSAKKPYINIQTTPTPAQVEQLIALNKRLMIGGNRWLDLLIENEQGLQQRLNDKNDPLIDYEFDPLIIFYHQQTDEILAVIDHCWGKYTANDDDQINWFRNQNHDYLYRLEFMGDEHISPWMGWLLCYYELHWYELLNIGKIELKFNTQYQYCDYINDQPSDEE